MKEENEDLMSIFNSGMELDMNFNEIDEIDENVADESTDESENTEDQDVTEQDDAENVGDDEDDNESEENDSDDESSPNLYSSIVNVLKEQGVIPSLESSEEIKSASDLIEVFKKEIEIQSQKKLDEYIDNLDVSKIAEAKKEGIALDTITEDSLKENLNLAKEIIYRDYLNQGLSEDRAKKMLKKTIDLGEDIVLEDALESLESIKQFNAKKIETEKLNYQKEIKQRQEEQAKLDLELKNKIYNSKEIIKGVPLTKVLQEKIYKGMTEVIGKNPDTGVLENKLMQDRAKDPVDFDIRMYSLYELTNGFTDFKKVINTTKSKAVSDFEKVLRSSKIEDNGVPVFLQDNQSYDGIGSELVV